MVTCKYGCGVKFPDTQQGKTSMMRHYRWKCPKNPKVIERLEQKKAKSKEKKVAPLEKIGQKAEYALLTEPEKELTEEDRLDEEQVLDKIIAEASMTRKRPAIVRMVRYVIGKKKESIEALAEALRIGDIVPSQRNLILRNWARHLEVEDVDYILKKEKDKELDSEKEEEKKTPVEKLREGVKRLYDDELERLEILKVRKQIADMERELSGEGKKGEEKHTMIVDGVALSLKPEQMMSWKRYLADEKRAEAEREERKAERKRQEEERKAERKQQDEERRNRESELKTHKSDELVEWVIGEGSSAKTVKVRPETIPLLIQSQGKKGGESDELKIMREEIKLMREQHQQFQTNVLHNEINELKSQVSVNPIDRLINDKNKFEQLGLITSGKTSAQEQLLKMDSKKLDTLLEIVLDKSKGAERKIDTLADVFGPLAKDYVRTAILAMKQQQQGGIPLEVPRTKEQVKQVLADLETVEKALSETEEPNGPPKVVDIEKTKKD